MVSRKKAAGKARKAAKAKAREEAEERNNCDELEEALKESRSRAREAAEEEERNNRQVNDELEEHTEQLPLDASALSNAPAPPLQPIPCQHSVHPLYEGIPSKFVHAFTESFNEAVGDGGRPLGSCLLDAMIATETHFAEVWNDSTKMKMAISSLLGRGTQHILKGDDDNARDDATLARSLEQYIAVSLHKTQTNISSPKLVEIYHADMHTLVKFFRHRIPCSCLDEKYEEVKSITKMGLCCNEKCTLPNRMTERSKTMYCSRCRFVTYCSRACQVFDWTNHKTCCDIYADK